MISPWLAVNHSQCQSAVTEYMQSRTSLHITDSSRPAFSTLVGRKTKSDVLRTWLKLPDKRALVDHHGQVCLWSDAATMQHSTPVIHIDYELQTYASSQSIAPSGTGPFIERQFSSYGGTLAPQVRRRVCNLLCARGIVPLCHTVCYFAADLGGTKAVAALIAQQTVLEPSSDLPASSLPCILVVTDTAAKHFDATAAEASLLNTIGEMMRLQQGIAGQECVESQIRRHYQRIIVLGVPRRTVIRHRAAIIRRRLLTIIAEVQAARIADQVSFRADHYFTFASRFLDHFCSNSSDLCSLVSISRPDGFTTKDYHSHIEELFSLLPAEIWLWHLAAPLVSSTILLANYPPSAHMFPVQWIFSHLYEGTIKACLSNLVPQLQTRQAFIAALERSLTADYEDLKRGAYRTVVDLHRDRLHSLKGYLTDIHSHKTCLCCLARAPEKVLACGHALCDTCIRVFASKSSESRHSFFMEQCFICGHALDMKPFQLLPPTAGVRLLSLDGGGIKGIVPLIFLRDLEAALARFKVPLRDHFDFVCGTSAGGLVAIGIFIMQWSAAICQERFVHLAKQTFDHKKTTGLLFGRFHQLVVSYMRDHKYSSQAIEDAFQDVTGNSSGLFNPLNSDTKVAVTSVTAREVQPCLFTNYNGGPRREDLGYNLIRAAKSADDVTIGEAASCTSAAPWYFKAKSIKHLGTFQDGGLQYNNPLSVALWELKHVWPNRASPDLALSIGTGVRNDSWMIGSQSPVKDRFVARIFRTFMKSMDGEKMWRDFFNSVPERARHRYHRLNITFEDPEPAIDDIAAMQTLEKITEAQIRRHPQKTLIINSMIASMFYFEFEKFPVWNGTRYLCVGNIFTRTQLPADGRKVLLDELSSTSSFFLLRGVPVVCVPKRRKHAPPFKRAVQFQLESLDDTVAITLRGITSEPCTISGLPKCATDIIAAQGLYAPFGRSDHVEQVEHASQRSLKRTRAAFDQ